MNQMKFSLLDMHFTVLELKSTHRLYLYELILHSIQSGMVKPTEKVHELIIHTM